MLLVYVLLLEMDVSEATNVREFCTSQKLGCNHHHSCTVLLETLLLSLKGRHLESFKNSLVVMEIISHWPFCKRIYSGQ